MITAILLSGGTGSRLGANIPKQYLELAGRPIIEYCLETLSKSVYIDEIIVVAAKEWVDFIGKCVKNAGCESKFLGFSAPGDNRQGSILHALEDIDSLKEKSQSLNEKPLDDFEAKHYVLVHDAARPFLTEDLIERMVSHIERNQSADGILPVLPMKDTVYFSEDGQQITSLLERSKVLAGQAPELFDFPLYYEANKRLNHEELMRINGSTEPAILADMKIAFVDGDEANFKITTLEDLKRAEDIMKGRTS